MSSYPFGNSTKEFVSEEVINQIREKASIYQVISDLTSTKITKSGSSYKMLCPFHKEKTPSFSINPQRGIYHCFGCGAGGGVYKFVMHHEGLSFPAAIKFVATKYAPGLVKLLPESFQAGQNKISHMLGHEEMQLDFEHKNLEEIISILNFTNDYFVNQIKNNTSDDAKVARDYILGRGVSKKIIKEMGIGYAPNNDVFIIKLMEKFPEYVKNGLMARCLKYAGLINHHGQTIFKNRLTFPVTTFSGNVLGFNSRRTIERENSKKYKNSPECITFDKAQLLGGMNQLDMKQVKENGLFIVEGPFDKIPFYEQNLNYVLDSGTCFVSEQQAEILLSFEPRAFYLMYDPDEAGKKGMISAAQILSKFNKVPDIYMVPLPKESDPFDTFHNGSHSITDFVDKNKIDKKEFIKLPDIAAMIAKKDIDVSAIVGDRRKRNCSVDEFLVR